MRPSIKKEPNHATRNTKNVSGCTVSGTTCASRGLHTAQLTIICQLACREHLFCKKYKAQCVWDSKWVSCARLVGYTCLGLQQSRVTLQGLNNLLWQMTACKVVCMDYLFFFFFNKLCSCIIFQPSSPVYTVDNSSINKIYIIKPTPSTIVPTVSMSIQLLKHCSQSMNGSQICQVIKIRML